MTKIKEFMTKGFAKYLVVAGAVGSTVLGAGKVGATALVSADIGTIAGGFISDLTGAVKDNLPAVLTFAGLMIVLWFFIALVKRGLHGH